MNPFWKTTVLGLVTVVIQFVADLFREHQNERRRRDRNDRYGYEPYDEFY